MKAVRTTVAALGVIVAGVLVLEAVIHWPDWRLPGDRGHSSSESTPKPAPSAQSSRSAGAPTGHMPPWHHGLIHGTKKDDVIYGTESGERIEAIAGRDKIIAQGGGDVLDGGTGPDLLMGGAGNDTYVLPHHGGGGDIILEESGRDTLQIVGGSLALSAIEFLRLGKDLLIRWNHERPADTVLIRSWFLGAQYHLERLQLSDGTVVALEPLAERAKEATSDEVIHFQPPK